MAKATAAAATPTIYSATASWPLSTAPTPPVQLCFHLTVPSFTTRICYNMLHNFAGYCGVWGTTLCPKPVDLH